MTFPGPPRRISPSAAVMSRMSRITSGASLRFRRASSSQKRRRASRLVKSRKPKFTGFHLIDKVPGVKQPGDMCLLHRHLSRVVGIRLRSRQCLHHISRLHRPVLLATVMRAASCEANVMRKKRDHHGFPVWASPLRVRRRLFEVKAGEQAHLRGYQKRHDGKYRKHHDVRCSRDWVVCEVLTNCGPLSQSTRSIPPQVKCQAPQNQGQAVSIVWVAWRNAELSTWLQK